MSIEILQPFRPVLGAKAYDGGGREVMGWLHCPQWRALLSWAQVLLERNVYGCLPYSTNPDPWPGYYDGIEAAEISHLNSAWYWNEVSEWLELVALHKTLTEVQQVYPQVTPEQVKELLEDFGLLS